MELRRVFGLFHVQVPFPFQGMRGAFEDMGGDYLHLVSIVCVAFTCLLCAVDQQIELASDVAFITCLVKQTQCCGVCSVRRKSSAHVPGPWRPCQVTLVY